MTIASGDNSGAAAPAADKRPIVLCVEDELVIALLVQDFLGDLGYDVVIAENAEQGCRLAVEHDLVAAILDVFLGQGNSFPVARVLQQRGVPFLFTSGAHAIDAEFDGIVCVPKPYSLDLLEDRFTSLLKS